MLENQTKLEKTPLVEEVDEEVEVGEWFNPFLNYHDLPYTLNREKHHTKTLLVLFRPVGSFIIKLEWRNHAIKRNGRGVLVLPFGNRTIHMEDYTKYEETLESKLLQIDVFCNESKYQEQELPYKVEIKTPLGEVFQSLFLENIGAEGLPIAGPNDWHRNSEENGSYLLFPEVENILEKIQIKLTNQGKET